MQMSEAARKQVLEPSEGLRLAAYKDAVGVWTIGYGHTTSAGAPVVKAGLTITAKEADAILSRDLRTFESAVWALVSKAKGGVSQNEFDALVDFAFNVGVGALAKSTLLKAYLAGEKQKAADKFLDWTKGGGKILPGLVARRKRERKWFLTGAA